MINLAKSAILAAAAAASTLSLAACQQKPDAGDAAKAAADAAQTPAAAPQATPDTTVGEGEAEGPLGVGDDDRAHGPRAGMERAREAREHGMGMAPAPGPAEGKPNP